jgi:hypothetical protein
MALFESIRKRKKMDKEIFQIWFGAYLYQMKQVENIEIRKTLA